MLNKDNQRELAYIAQVTNIAPMDAERLECVYINGWTCVCGKGDFKIGDVGVFFEPDSKLPDVEPFNEIEFLKKKDFKIKAQKIRGVVSQGLFMPINAFGWVIDDADGSIIIPPEKYGETIVLNVGDFLTERLGVTYAVVEDNKRKAPSVDKYKKMAQRYPNLFKKRLFRWLMRRTWGKKLLFVFFGKKRDKRNSFPSWVVKTDEERCVPGNTKVLTDCGYICINKIVNKHLPVKVASMGKDGAIEYKKITDYQKFNNSNEMITIRYPHHIDTERTNALCCTNDHKVLTQRGYIKAKDITTNDFVYEPTNAFSDDAIEAIYGMLLGDSHISRDKRSNGLLGVVSTNGEKQLDYLKYKCNMFEGENKIVQSTKPNGMWNKLPVYHGCIKKDPYLSYMIRKDWFRGGKKEVTEDVVRKLTDVSLAFWYMDDGCLSFRNNCSNQPWVRLNTQGFTLEENELLSTTLKNTFGVDNNVCKSKISKDGNQMYHISLTSEGTKKFLKIVSKYIHPSMRYKLPEEYANIPFSEMKYSKSYRVLPCKVVSVEKGQHKNKIWAKTFSVVYDIEVEDNHNFIADGIVVHNCQNMPWLFNDREKRWIATEKVDGSSTTFTIKGFGRKQEFLVCSRNVCFDSPDKEGKCFYETNIYTEMAQKYNMKTLMQNALKTAHELDSKIEFLTIQAETFGKTVQKRDYGMDCHDMRVFNIIWGYKDGTTTRLNPIYGAKQAEFWGLPYVPIVNDNYQLPETCDEVLAYAGGKSAIDGGMREGLVFRSEDGSQSFKAVDPEFLVKYHG